MQTGRKIKECNSGHWMEREIYPRCEMYRWVWFFFQCIYFRTTRNLFHIFDIIPKIPTATGHFFFCFVFWCLILLISISRALSLFPQTFSKDVFLSATMPVIYQKIDACNNYVCLICLEFPICVNAEIPEDGNFFLLYNLWWFMYWAALSCHCKYSVSTSWPHPDIMWSIVSVAGCAAPNNSGHYIVTSWLEGTDPRHQLWILQLASYWIFWQNRILEVIV